MCNRRHWLLLVGSLDHSSLGNNGGAETARPRVLAVLVISGCFPHLSDTRHGRTNSGIASNPGRT